MSEILTRCHRINIPDFVAIEVYDDVTFEGTATEVTKVIRQGMNTVLLTGGTPELLLQALAQQLGFEVVKP